MPPSPISSSAGTRSPACASIATADTRRSRRRAPYSPPAGSGRSTAIPPIRAASGARGWRSPRARARCSPTSSSCSSTRQRSPRASIRCRWSPRPCAARGRRSSTSSGSASWPASIPAATWRRATSRPRRVPRDAGGAARVFGLPGGAGHALCGTFPEHLRRLHGGRHRPARRADSGRTRRALPHGRHRGRRARAVVDLRPVGLRRMQRDWPPRRQPAGEQLAARSDRLPAPRRARRRRLASAEALACGGVRR